MNNEGDAFTVQYGLCFLNNFLLINVGQGFLWITFTGALVWSGLLLRATTGPDGAAVRSDALLRVNNDHQARYG